MDAPPYELGLPPYSDDIPYYAPSLEYYGVAMAKTEFETPWSCRSGPMVPVVVELNSNQLRVYELAAEKSVISVVEALFMFQNYEDESPADATGPTDKTAAMDALFDGDVYGDDCCAGLSPTVISKLRKRFSNRKIQKKLSGVLPPQLRNNGLLLEPTADHAVYSRFAANHRGKLLHCLTLQNLSVGEAPSLNLHNYKEDGSVKYSSSVSLLNYRNALRLRIEHFQLLLHFWSFYGMVHWYRNLSIGRDLSLLLDTRVTGRFKSIPRNFSTRNNALLEASAREASRLHYGAMVKHRNSVTSIDSDLDGSSVMSSIGTSIGTSVDTSTDSLNSHLNMSGKLTMSIDVYGNKVVCYEAIYTPAEKQYISNCIPTLNSFDKWSGSAMTLSNYQDLLPKNDAQNVNSNGRVFISYSTFNSLVKNHMKNVQRSQGTLKNHCMEFYVDDTGLVSIDDE